jgi:CRP-like cAMP-binding protein
MTATVDYPLKALIAKLGRLSGLDHEDRIALAKLTYRTEHVAASRKLVRERQEASDCCLLMEGYACRYKRASGGGRQIVSFHLPGDVLNLQHLFLSRADHFVQAITEAKVAWIPTAELKRLCWDRPRIGEALWRDCLIDASMFREWVLNVGRRDAKSRVAHMLCEFAARGDKAGLGPPERFDLPMTQADIADATGLTPVHVNRMLRKLRDEGLIVQDKREVRIVDWARMREAADFDPAYLHAAA